MIKTVKEVAESIAPCGLICALCIKSIKEQCKGCGTNGEVCSILECCKNRAIRGCWECNDFPCCECNFRGIRIRAFLQCAKDEGVDKLAEYLIHNQRNGLRYHYYFTFHGDYDGYQRIDDVLQMLRTGKTSVSPYERCPVYETETFILRFVKESDAEDLLECYSNNESCRLFNSDNCSYGFYYNSLQDMKACINQWINEYDNKAFIRFAIINKKSGKAIGTIEIFSLAEVDEQYNKVGVLRIDLLPAFEYKQYISEILKIANNNFYEVFLIDHIITKAIPEAVERRNALISNGFSPLEINKIIPYSGYFIR